MIKLLKKVFLKLYSIFLKILSAFIRILPLKNRVFFYSIRNNDSLLENAKCVYDMLGKEKVCIAKMLPHGYFLIPKIYYYLLTSKVIVTDDYLKYLRMTKLRPEQKVVQIWHACGAFKRFGLDAPSRLSAREERDTHSRYDAVCVSSDYVRRHYASAFGIDEDKIFATGVPRTDKLFDENYICSQKQSLLEKYQFLKDKKIYLYCPTFRENDGTVYNFDFKIDFEKLSENLSDDEVFIVKRHPIMKDKFFENGEYKGIYDISEESVLSLISLSDTVITDYSSVIFESVLMNKNVVFYCPDLNSYERSFYLEYPEELPGEVVEDSNFLLEKIRETSSCTKSEKYTSFREKELSACDGNSTERVVKMIEEYLS